MTIILTIKNRHLTVDHIETLTELVFTVLITSKPDGAVHRLLELGC